MREESSDPMQYDELLNQTVRVLKPSGIRRFFDIANEMEDVISLSARRVSARWRRAKPGIRPTPGC